MASFSSDGYQGDIVEVGWSGAVPCNHRTSIALALESGKTRAPKVCLSGRKGLGWYGRIRLRWGTEPVLGRATLRK